MAQNDWCGVLGIEVPRLEALVNHSEANTYSLLLVALLEHGAPMTLAAVAARFEQAGIERAERALQGLKRCRPARPPVYRDGELYSLDPHDRLLDLWAFRLGLRPPRVARRQQEPEPPPAPDARLTHAELDEAWKDASLSGWSATRIALAVLDANGGPSAPSDVVAAVARRTPWHVLNTRSVQFGRRGSPISVLSDGRWAIADGATSALVAVRSAVRDRAALARRHRSFAPDPEAIAAFDRERARRRAELGRLSRALLVGFPADRPRVLTLLDVRERTLATAVDEEIPDLIARASQFEVIGAVNVRALLRALDIEPARRRLAELGPPQKSIKLNRRGRTLAITTKMLIQGSCGIAKPFGDPARLQAYLEKRQLTELRRRLEADAKALYALYEYGRLHGCVRLRWGFLDERLPAPWVDSVEPTLRELVLCAREHDVPLEVVVGSAPGWADPWSRAQQVRVVPGPQAWSSYLVAESGLTIDEAEVQRARLAVDWH